MAQLYCVTCSIHGWKYWGIVYKPGKTYLDRFIDHLTGKPGCGAHLHRAILKYGKENFTTELVQEGDLDQIRLREIEESTKTLYAKQSGWNGNMGRIIPFSLENLEKRRQTIANTPVHEYRKWHQSLLNNIKRTPDRVKRQKESLKKRWLNPTIKMLEGKQKEALTKKGRTKYNHKGCKIQSEKMMGRYSCGTWITPFGHFNTAKLAGLSIGDNFRGVIRLCRKNILLTRCVLNKTNLPKEWLGKMSGSVGFGFIPKTTS